MTATDAHGATHQAIETVFRMERARLIGGLARLVRDLDLAEELTQDAFVIALAEWPECGVPRNPGAWLMTVGKRRAVERIRRNTSLARKYAAIGSDLNLAEDPELAAVETASDDEIGDELLGLVFTACHPVLALEARLALTLRLIGDLTTNEIARAFLTSEATIAQRISRAKRTLANAGVAFAVPRGAELDERLPAVLEVVYLMFNEGYAATRGDDLIRPALCREAQRLGRILAGLMPAEPEILGLLALMELHASRLPTRTAPDGTPVPLPEQNRARWDHVLVRRGLDTLARAEALGASRGPYTFQAAIAGCHARARRFEQTDWERIAALYDELLAVQPNPVVELNRAVAHSMAYGPDTGLLMVDAIAMDARLANYAPLPAARGDFLFRAGRLSEAQAQFTLAASLSQNPHEQTFLLRRADACIRDNEQGGNWQTGGARAGAVPAEA